MDLSCPYKFVCADAGTKIAESTIIQKHLIASVPGVSITPRPSVSLKIPRANPLLFCMSLEFLFIILQFIMILDERPILNSSFWGCVCFWQALCYNSHQITLEEGVVNCCFEKLQYGVHRIELNRELCDWTWKEAGSGVPKSM